MNAGLCDVKRRFEIHRVSCTPVLEPQSIGPSVGHGPSTIEPSTQLAPTSSRHSHRAHWLLLMASWLYFTDCVWFHKTLIPYYSAHLSFSFPSIFLIDYQLQQLRRTRSTQRLISVNQVVAANTSGNILEVVWCNRKAKLALPGHQFSRENLQLPSK